MASVRKKALNHTPARSGFRMPAEWEPHEATWLGWPHNADDWPGKLATIHWVYGEIVRKLADGERVRILVQSRTHEDRARHGPEPILPLSSFFGLPRIAGGLVTSVRCL